MNPDSFKSEISAIFDSFTGIRVMFIVKEEDSYQLKLSKIDTNALPKIVEGFKNRLYEDVVNNDDLTIPLLSNFDDRKNALFEFDYEEYPKEFNFINNAIAIPPNSQDFYDLNNKFIDVKGIIIQLRGNNKCLSLYKHKTNLMVFEQSRKLFNMIPDSDGYLKELPTQVFRLDYNYDIVLLNDEFLIKNLTTLETTMQFHQVIEAQATVALESLKSSLLIEDLTHLEKSSKEISFSRKLAKISKHSPVLGKIDVPVIIDYVSKHTYLSTVLIISDDGTQLLVKTKESQKHFIKLLSDDYLESPLTKILYDSLAKDELKTH
ncbi:anti-phage protein KwaB [Buttiauxella brennerae]|uniref:anti-phage protein KwaB n=1 Tax=Buttiauxella brennerae TaxID=82988 RepID=UPI00286F2710|nr:anti-phage protein KwaB [Buttiauxella brennerae]